MQHPSDLGGKLIVQLVSEDVLYAALHEQILSAEREIENNELKCREKENHTKRSKTRDTIFVYLLYPQTKVEDAVRAVSLSIGPTHFFDEARQSKAQLSRVTLKDVFFNIYWTGYREERPYSTVGIG